MLDLKSNRVADIVSGMKVLSNLTELEVLNLTLNKISDIAPLAALMELKVLYLWHNEISDLTPLANLTRFEGIISLA